MKYNYEFGLKILIKYGANINCQNDDLDTPLHLACKLNSISNVVFLLKNGCSFNIKNKLGHLPIYYSLMNESFEILQILKSFGAEFTSSLENLRITENLEFFLNSL